MSVPFPGRNGRIQAIAGEVDMGYRIVVRLEGSKLELLLSASCAVGLMLVLLVLWAYPLLAALFGWPWDDWSEAPLPELSESGERLLYAAAGILAIVGGYVASRRSCGRHGWDSEGVSAMLAAYAVVPLLEVGLLAVGYRMLTSEWGSGWFWLENLWGALLLCWGNGYLFGWAACSRAAALEDRTTSGANGN